ncbi:MAG: OsmC family protein [Bacteroidota bacterium]|nr:OsmC family protein [Bacteroidota bacterium]MDX5431120.1 OsmC family protein [Bacteroidota bacterium]MDX5469869.1 OsmC family protein [Bacteroidota bacterium]
MAKEHHYQAEIIWTGNRGLGTSSYQEYDRSHLIRVSGKPDWEASSDVPFRGDGSKYNPEDMLLISLSSCHMLWYLHLCADAGVIVMDYRDEASGTLQMGEGGKGRFSEVILRPRVKVSRADMVEQANALHQKAHEFCFIANSVNFPVLQEPKAFHTVWV